MKKAILLTHQAIPYNLTYTKLTTTIKIINYNKILKTRKTRSANNLRKWLNP